MQQKKNKPTKYRDENFKLLESLQFVSSDQGLAVMGFDSRGTIEHQEWSVRYFDRSKMLEPQMIECRDEIDYSLKLEAWRKACTVRSIWYGSFKGMVDSEINRLKATL